MITRTLESVLKNHLNKGMAIVVYGSRQVGKTTLVKKLLKEYGDDGIYLNCDEPYVIEGLQNKNSFELYEFVQRKKFVVLDEAQRVENIGLTIKLLVDTYPDIQIVATGSSSFELANKIKEPLTGRAIFLTLYPFSISELAESEGTPPHMLAMRMMQTGSYPRAWNLSGNDSAEYLLELTSNFLYKDLLQFELLRQAPLVMKLLRALALQLGNEVSYAELAKLLQVDAKTVERYIFLLEQVFVIFRLNAFRNNPRREIGRLRKVYFYDLGVRNSLLQNFNPPELRTDIGALWENFCILEKLKINSYKNSHTQSYFWREPQGQEVDYVEVKNGIVSSYEFKWNSTKTSKVPPAFEKLYPDATYAVINPKNVYTSFL